MIPETGWSPLGLQPVSGYGLILLKIPALCVEDSHSKLSAEQTGERANQKDPHRYSDR